MDANVPDQSKRLIEALRHSMASYYLATKKPHRTMYTASTSADGCGISEDAGVHKVVPVPSTAEWRQYTFDGISSLGSSKIPEVELMNISQHQIKVENCTAAKYISPSPEAVCRGENCTVKREAETQHLWPIDLSPVRTEPGGQPKYGFW
ncbi:glycosyltransferase family 15 protein [Colletotrichum scovillei]|nr:glycosyltransferase family 15 protein [Colletotrichum scovillei]